MAACAFGVPDSHAPRSISHVAPHHVDKPIRAITPGECGSPALLVMDYIAPQHPETPETVIVPVFPTAIPAIVMSSTAIQIDPPPPRA